MGSGAISCPEGETLLNDECLPTVQTSGNGIEKKETEIPPPGASVLTKAQYLLGK